MKKVFFAIVIAQTIILSSCSKDFVESDRFSGMQAEMVISVNDVLSKAIGVTAANESTVGNFDIFVFDVATGLLDGYGRAASNSAINIKAGTGSKHIFALANRQSDFNATAVKTEANFLAQTTKMLKENSSAFSMVGDTTKTLTSSSVNNISVNVKRFVAKIALTSLSVDFSGTPLAGQKLENVKIYLKGVPSEKLFSGQPTSTPQYINGKTSEWTSAATCAGLLLDEVAQIPDEGSTTNHNFYPYERWSNTALTSNSCIRLVITADIDGNNDGVKENYTWSFPINTSANTGKTDLIDHFGVKANHTYTVSAKISRLGIPSTNPSAEDTDTDYSQNSINVSVIPWSTGSTFDVVF